MLCDASSLPISNTFTYDAIRDKNCNVIVCFSLSEAEYKQKKWKKPAYVYKIHSKRVSKKVSGPKGSDTQLNRPVFTLKSNLDQIYVT